MEVAGYIPEDAPDPAGERHARIAALGIPVAGLVPQPNLEDLGELGVAESRRWQGDGPEVLVEASVSRTYLLRRNPDDRDDPANLARLDPRTEAQLDRPLERAIPAWLHEARRLLRFPRLWEAVQTHWTAPGEERGTVTDRLLAHAEYVLTNQYREELGLGTGPGSWAPPIPPAALQPAPVVVDGTPRPGLLLDTDPFVQGLGVELADGRMVTVVVARDALPLLRLELADDLPLDPAGP